MKSAIQRLNDAIARFRSGHDMAGAEIPDLEAMQREERGLPPIPPEDRVAMNPVFRRPQRTAQQVMLDLDISAALHHE